MPSSSYSFHVNAPCSGVSIPSAFGQGARQIHPVTERLLAFLTKSHNSASVADRDTLTPRRLAGQWLRHGGMGSSARFAPVVFTLGCETLGHRCDNVPLPPSTG